MRGPLVVLGLTVILIGCATTAPAAQESPPATPTGFTNPVYDSNFPDPMIISAPDGTAYAFATNGNGSNVQVLTSPDLVTWTQAADALPELPDWTSPGKVWAPEVAAHADDRYVMYYTTRAPDPEIQCVGVAVAGAPGGPYLDENPGPLLCEEDQGGTIDAHPFTAADGTRYLFWKNDGNAVGVDTYLSVARLSADGTTLAGKPQRLFKQDLPWEGELVEAPFVWERGGVFHLFYSANSFASADYAVGHAVADSPLGPFTKSGDPILVGNEVAAGPGHNSLFERNGKVWMVYHAWAPDAVGSDFPGRTMWLSEVTFSGRTASVVPPTVEYPTRP